MHRGSRFLSGIRSCPDSDTGGKKAKESLRRLSFLFADVIKMKLMDFTSTGVNDRLTRLSQESEKRVLPDPSSFCPNCSAKLVDHRCKLKCPQCGYYLSCSDFY